MGGRGALRAVLPGLGRVRPPAARARRLLVNGVSALAAVGAWNLTMGALGLGVQVNLALLTAGAALGVPGAALIGVLQRMAQG